MPALVFAGPVLREDHTRGMHAVPLPVEIDRALGDARVVTGTVCGVPFRRVVHGRGNGTPHLRFGRAVLREAGLGLGATAVVELEPAADPDAVDVPVELAAALVQDPEAAARWATFTPGRQRSLCVHVAGARRPETRERRALDLVRKVRTHTLHGDR